MTIERTAESEKKPVYTKPGVRELDAAGEASRGNCSTGTVAFLDPKKKT